MKSIKNSKDYNPIICAVDTTDINKAKQLVENISPHVGTIKLGLEFFTANGATGVRQIIGDKPLFLDLKFHDIPNTVAGAIRATKDINCFMLTVHTLGGKEMMKAASQAAKELEHKPMTIGVTILTSMGNTDIEDIGISHSVSEQVKKLASLAQESGLDGVVCSPHEIEILRKQCGDSFKLIVPAIRPEGSENGDQKRVMTPKEAIEKGADYLVIGRPITQAENPASMASGLFDLIREL
ncbi:MAG: orotidine-5'-phosphate decarboxylase [Rickettsiales bacterium]